MSCSEECSSSQYVCAYVSVDNFARPTFLSRQADGRFSGSRFLPPTTEPILLVFQIDKKLEVALDMPRMSLKQPLRLALAGDGADATDILSEGSDPDAKKPNIAAIKQAIV